LPWIAGRGEAWFAAALKELQQEWNEFGVGLEQYWPNHLGEVR
jgi:hypothetical protein